MTELFVVMPVYNEQESLEYVVKEWISELRQHTSNFVFYVINDGSTDRSLEILQNLQYNYTELKVTSKPNNGHGQACLAGYLAAVRDGASWILQIDSDGQCLPEYFTEFWQQRLDADALYGSRKIRDDSLVRMCLSRLLAVILVLPTGVWITDPNVPYRFMKGEKVAAIIIALPLNAEMVNVFLAGATQKCLDITWIDIRFGKRRGSKKLKWSTLASLIVGLAVQLIRYRKSFASISNKPVR